MLTFTNNKVITSIERQIYVNSKSTYATQTSSSIPLTGYFRPLSEEQATLNGLQWGQGFSLICESGKDVRIGDRITIEGVAYTCRGVVDHDRGGIVSYVRAVLTKPEA